MFACFFPGGRGVLTPRTTRPDSTRASAPGPSPAPPLAFLHSLQPCRKSSICACPAQSVNRDVRISFVVPHIRAIDYVQKLLRIVGIRPALRGTGKFVLDEDQRLEIGTAS